MFLWTQKPSVICGPSQPPKGMDVLLSHPTLPHEELPGDAMQTHSICYLQFSRIWSDYLCSFILHCLLKWNVGEELPMPSKGTGIFDRDSQCFCGVQWLVSREFTPSLRVHSPPAMSAGTAIGASTPFPNVLSHLEVRKIHGGRGKKRH